MKPQRIKRKLLQDSDKSGKTLVTEQTICIPLSLFNEIDKMLKGFKSNGGRADYLHKELSKFSRKS